MQPLLWPKVIANQIYHIDMCGSTFSDDYTFISTVYSFYGHFIVIIKVIKFELLESVHAIRHIQAIHKKFLSNQLITNVQHTHTRR